jgi:hypothetical protein
LQGEGRGLKVFAGTALPTSNHNESSLSLKAHALAGMMRLKKVVFEHKRSSVSYRISVSLAQDSQ